jgi:serine-aspartate repeat-containing protein C/D/E
VVSNWSGGLVDQVGVFRGNGLWLVDNLGLGTWSPSDATFFYGCAGDYPVVGNWYGDRSSPISPLRIGRPSSQHGPMDP